MPDTPKSYPLLQPGALLHKRGQSLDKGTAIAPPITTASMFHLPGQPDGSDFYGRATNPTWGETEALLSALEGAPALLFPSGMAAISAAFFATLRAGMRLLLPSDGYYATRRLAETFLAPLGVTIEERATANFGAGGFAGFDVVFVETPSNPGLDMIDLAAVAAEVRAAGGITIADNTTLTPLGQRPLDLGVDIVVSSDTKCMGGHSDLLAGHVASRDPALIAAMENWRMLSGSIPGAHTAWLLHRGLETLEVRFDRMCSTAGTIAARLADHPALTRLRYPGLPQDPAHNLAKAQCAQFGFLIGLTLSDEETAEAFINTCPLIRPATSFGGIHTSAERRARWGDAVDPGFVRLSIGVEPVEELWDAVSAGL
ncbi:cystathionine gamma-lyase [Epibacterium ulvae]|uniref:cystathionine gamma-lyase n=1 Tax=Epibacterium ulvae TaxID=1156985 RepID=UPI001BFC48AE|nr:cystathionine gamma-lyase [Epibacterium ulvae]MBT8154302.1 cystathionine gamma-lyase [Epibacterium ulvae]